jgi:hypothetical protein
MSAGTRARGWVTGLSWAAIACGGGSPAKAPEVEMVAQDLYAETLALDDTRLYVGESAHHTVNHASLVAITLSDGKALELAPPSDLRSIAANGRSVFFTKGAGLFSVEPGGGGTTVLSPEADRLAATASTVFFTVPGAVLDGPDQGEVRSVPVGGGAVTLVADGQDQLGEVKADAEHVYWTLFATSGAIRRAPVAGGPVEEVVSGVVSPRGLAISGGFLYWADGGPNEGRISRMHLAGGEPVELVTGERRPAGLAVDDTHVYWASSVAAVGEIRRIPIDGGAAEVLARDQNLPVSVCVDDAAVYWGNTLDATVVRWRKATAR